MGRFSFLSQARQQMFGLDLRSLAIFRVGIGLLILCDLVLRSGDLAAFYSDQGILPRELVASGLALNWQWSLHMINGTPGFQGLLFGLAGAAAVMMVVGYRTQLATLVSWVMLVSLHARNPLILNAGDTYLAILTFWGIFLPLGARWSLDNKRNVVSSENREANCPAPSVVSLATFALHLQIVMVYVGTALMKRGHDAWQSGDAIRLSLSKDFVVTRLGQSLVEYPDFLYLLTQATLYLEILGPLALVLSRGWLRLAVVVVFIAFHGALAACFTIGLFPYVCIVAFVAFVPAGFWNRVLKHSNEQQRPIEDSLTVGSRFRFAYFGKQFVLLLALTVGVWTSLGAVAAWVEVPENLRKLGLAFRWSQKWQMFVDLTESKNGWFVFHAQFVDGKSEDLQTGLSPVSYEKPELVSATFKNFRWRKLCTNLRREKYKLVRTYFGEYLLLERDKRHHDVHRVVGFEISFLSPAEATAGDDQESYHVLTFNKPYPTSIATDKEVLYVWRNEALKYQDVFIRE